MICLTDEQLSELLEKAEKATEGPWSCGIGYRMNEYNTGIPCNEVQVLENGWVKQIIVNNVSCENQKYIAAANPETIKALVMELKELRAKPTPTPDQWKQIREALELCSEAGPKDNGKPEHGIACAFCDMGEAGYATRGNGFHDDDCGVAESQKALALMDEIEGKK